MLRTLKSPRYRIIHIIVLATVIVPMLYVAYRLLSTGEDSVAVFVDTPGIIAFLIVCYYALLGILGAGYLVSEVVTYFNLKTEMKKSELLHLQHQVNPHFFFNMLNNLYGLIDNHAPRAKELILQLSDLMRYSIYDGQREEVTLAEEIAYMQSFIKLHEMRYQKNIDIDLQVDVKDDQIKVLPLMFIILLENAFKHGVENLRKGAYVHAGMKSTNNSITFTVANNYDPAELNNKKGVGLSNLKKRLDIAYGKKSKLTITVIDHVYTANLQLSNL